MTENGGTSLLPTTILRDAREQHPWEFEKIPVDTRDVTLSTGDYAVPAHCSYDPKLETYHPVFAVERKTGPDLLNSITWERNRFEREIQRASHWEQPLSVVVETSWQSFLRDRGCMANRDIHPAQVAGTVSAWSNYHNVSFHFTETPRQAERCALLLIVRHCLVQRLD